MRFLLILWILLITALSLIPLEFKVELGTTGKLHSVGHYAAFMITAGLFCWNANDLARRVLRCVAALGLAFLLEGLEVVFYRNRFEWTDIASDSLGIISGLVLVMLIQLRAARGRPHTSQR